MSWIDKIELMVENEEQNKEINIFNKRFKISNNKKSKIHFLNSVRYFSKKIIQILKN